MSKKYNTGDKLNSPLDQFKAQSLEDQAEAVRKMWTKSDEKNRENYDAIIDKLNALARKYCTFAGYYEVQKTYEDLGLEHSWTTTARLALDVSLLCEQMRDEIANTELETLATDYEDWLDIYIDEDFCKNIDDPDEVLSFSRPEYIVLEAMTAQVCQQVWPAIAQFGQEYKAMQAEIEKFQEVWKETSEACQESK